MGVETPQPVINDRCYQLNFTNEGGVGGTTRLLKNIAGLWLVQECRRIWKQQGRDYGFDDLIRRAGEASPLAVAHQSRPSQLRRPQGHAAAIRDFCAATGQAAPATEGAMIRCALESLALRYRMVLGFLEELIGGRIETIHIVGGGAQNRAALPDDRRRPRPPRRRRPRRSHRHRQPRHASHRPRRHRQHRPGPRNHPHQLRRPGIPPPPAAAWDEAYERFEKLVAVLGLSITDTETRRTAHRTVY